jgi:serine/threonine protein kinase
MFQPGTLIDNRYRVERLLGRGGMSNIYVCQDTRLGGTQHAVKEMTARYSNPEEQAAALNHFHREANLLARLSHPSLPTVSDYFQFQGRYYLVMEYVKGEDLGRILSRVAGPLPERQVAEWGVEIATVLYYLHCQKPDAIIFRDVKPSNIMIDGAKVKLIDFGIARHFNPSKKGDTMRIGSPGYAPPEQYSGQTDPRSDIYALGVTLHQALTGRDPTQTQTPFQLPPVRSLNPQVSEEMAWIIGRATQMLPENRYQDMLEMKRDLKGVVDAHRGGTTVVHSPGPTPGASPGPQPAAGSAAPATTGPVASPGLPKLPPPNPTPAAGPPPTPTTPPQSGRPGWSCSRMVALLLILAGFGFGFRVLGTPENLARLRNLASLWPGTPPPTTDTGTRLYLEGAPVGQALEALTKRLSVSPQDGATWIYWSNALAELHSGKHLTLGILIPQGPGEESLLRGVALAQRALNGQGGIQTRPVVLVLERPKPEGIGAALNRLVQGRSGRQTPTGGDRAGQGVDGVLLFAEPQALQQAGPQPVPTFAVPSQPREGDRTLTHPGQQGMVQALTELAQGRSLVVFDASFEKALKESRVSTRRISPDPEADLATLPQKDPSALVAVSAQGLSPQLLAALLKTGAEVVLLTDDLRKLPEVSPEGHGRVRALLALSEFHPWPEGAATSRLFPATFGSGPAELDPATARACDAVRWMAGTVLGEGPEYRGATLAANRTGQVRPAPHQLFEAGPGGWFFRRSLEGRE